MLNNFEKEVKLIWDCGNLDQARTLLISLIENFKATKQQKKHLESVSSLNSLTKIKKLATDLYMQEFDDTKGLSKSCFPQKKKKQ